MIKIIFAISFMFFCTSAFASGNPIVVFSLLGEVLALIIVVIYIFSKKAKKERKIKALIFISLGIFFVIFFANIPCYEDYAAWIDLASLISVFIAMLLAIFILQDRNTYLSKKDFEKSQENNDL